MVGNVQDNDQWVLPEKHEALAENNFERLLEVAEAPQLDSNPPGVQATIDLFLKLAEEPTVLPSGEPLYSSKWSLPLLTALNRLFGLSEGRQHAARHLSPANIKALLSLLIYHAVRLMPFRADELWQVSSKTCCHQQPHLAS